jgi:protein-S-isoprenylcysteine O-methyltransferase Ste14
MAMSSRIGKILYGLLFCAAVPALLILWSIYSPVILSVGAWQNYGWVALAVGVILIVMGMAQLWIQGKGLPMNAYPPERYVATGVYYYFNHPIYVGFCATCFAVAAITQSPGGFYLVAPVTVLLCWALVKGYEEPDLKRRFGLSATPEPDQPVTLQQKIKVIVPLFIGWFLGYEVIVSIGYDAGYFDTTFSWEKTLPVIELAEIPYAFTYALVFITPWLIRTQAQLNFFKKAGLWIVLIGFFLQWLLPLYSAPREFVPQSWLGDMIISERMMDTPAAAFPSFHAVWALLAAGTLMRIYPNLKLAWVSMAILILWSCIAVGAHSMLDIVGAIALYAVIVKRKRIFTVLQHASEYLANSWTHWQFSGLRIINHAFYSALAAFIGALIVGQFLENEWHILIMISGSLIGGVVWGQWIEGSSRMLRPFGYFGAILGGVFTAIVISYLYDYSLIVLIAAVALAAPWTQAIGRLRCLVQGCCHGSITQNGFGIRYTNEHSRVCAISDLKNKPLHNTQGYSIVFNVITGLILLRLWYGGSSPALIAGLYFILSGATRFVEEQFRGEVQTRFIKGLRLYQWLAIGSILTGIFFTMIKTHEPVMLRWDFSPTMVLVACSTGLLWAFGMSMDFPKSTARFSRLTG